MNAPTVKKDPTPPISVTVALKFPLPHEGKQIASVTLRRAKVRDIEAIEDARENQGAVAAGVVAVAALTGLPVEVVREMDAEDYATISGVLESFLPRPSSPPGPTGARSQEL